VTDGQDPSLDQDELWGTNFQIKKERKQENDAGGIRLSVSRGGGEG